MQKTFTKLLTFLCLGSLISSCAGIKPHHRSYGETGESPTVTINDFKQETQRKELDQLIVENKSPKKSEVFFLKAKDTKKINKWIKYFTKNGKRSFETFLYNGEKYRPIVEKIFEKHNLPKELFYVGLIESGYKNHARSHAGAVGPWQFIKETARRYGLKVTSSIDERKNIYKSTQAAALYFQDLYNIFGSWELALTAYNAGEYGVIRRIRGANTRDFFELSKRKVLPRETRNYVPKIIAAKTVDKNRSRYNIKVKKSSDHFYSNVKSYKIKGSIGLNKLSQKLGVSKKIIKQLNHDIRRNYIPYLGRNGFEIYLPKSKISTSKLNRIIAESKRTTVQEKKYSPKRKAAITNKRSHKVRKNESLFSISKRYNVTLRTLRRINNLKSSTIYVGQKIYLPGSQTSGVKKSYTVRKGDHLSKIARMFKTNVKKLKSLNKLKKSSIYAGQKIKVPAHKSKVHTVKSGEVLTKIARRYKTSLAEIVAINNIKASRIYPGQKLIVKLIKI